MFTVLALALAASAPNPAPPVTEATPTFTTEVQRIHRPDGTDLIVVVPEVYAFGAEAGDTIVVRFPGSDGIERADFQATCDDWGGHLEWTTMWNGGDTLAQGEFACDDVDF